VHSSYNAKVFRRIRSYFLALLLTFSTTGWWNNTCIGRKCTLAASLAAPGESRYADGTDRRTDARPSHYAFTYGRGQSKNEDYQYQKTL